MKHALIKQAEADLAALVKVADAKSALSLEYLKTIMKPLLIGLAASGATGLASYHFAKKDKERHDEELSNSMRSLANKSPEFAKAPAKFLERFGELTVISPTIAKNPTLAAKLLEKKLHTGFDVDDIHKLTSIEQNTTTSNRMPSPSGAARASAGSAFQSLMQTFGPEAVKDIKDAGFKWKSGRTKVDEQQTNFAKALSSALTTGPAADAARARYLAKNRGKDK